MEIHIYRSSPRPFSPIAQVTGCALTVLVAVLAGCSTMGARAKQLVPTNHKLRVGPFLLSSDFELKPESPVVQSLEALERDVAQALNLAASSADSTIEVYILNDRDSFTHFLRFYYPELPSRRAFFIAQGESRVVYTFQSPKLEEDLRHEATHALLNLRFGDLPLWLDEGLAEYFEATAPALDGSHEHLNKLPGDLVEGWKPDLKRLEALADIRQMTPADYREAWAWVYLLLNRPGKGRATLLDYLQQKPEDRVNDGLSAKLEAAGVPFDDAALVAYLNSVRSNNRRVTQSPPVKERVIRFQDRPAEASTVVEQLPPSKEQKGFFRRLGSLLFGN